MKLTCLLLTILLMQFHARLFSQSITWAGKNVQVEKIFDVVKKQTGYFFFYNNKNLKGAHRVTINVRNASLTEVLSKCAEGQPFDYVIEKNKTIVITRKLIPVEQSKAEVVVKNDSIHAVSGRIIDEKGEPLVGATVTVDATNIATAATNDGSFSLQVPDSKRELIVSSIGYAEEHVTITAFSDLLVVMKGKGFIESSDVMVIGYGTTKRTDLTGSISQVNLKDIRDRQNPDLPTLLQGKVAGLDVNAGSIRVRGVTSFNNTDPLVVIDGFLGGSMETVNPNDIENIEVLKDASSTAIYGARGSNGVILVTTRKPKAGPTRISISINSGVAVAPKKLKVLNASQYVDYIQEGLKNAGLAVPEKLLTPGVRVDATDWQDAVFKTSHSNSVDISFAGGSDNATFYVSMGYKRADEIYIGPSHDDITARFKNDFRIKKWLRFGDNAAFAYRIKRGAGPSFVISMINMQPYLPVRDTANYWGFGSVNRLTDFGDAINPVASSALTHPLSNTFDYLANIWAEIEPFRSLQYHMQYGLLGSFNRSTLWTDKYNNSAQQTIVNTFTDNSAYTLNPVWESYLTYSHKFGKHDLTLMAGNSRQNFSSAGSISIYGQNYANVGIRSVFNAASSYITGETFGKYAFDSYFGRFNYQYNGKYLLTVNMRRDGSPRFAPKYRWGNFPSLALSWKLQEENFIKMLDIFDQLKLRASIGVAGNDAIGDFKYLSQIYTNGVYYALGNPAAPVSGATIIDDATQNIKWESTTSKTVGMDMSILRNALSITVEYFVRNSNDILFSVPRPLSLGYGLGVTGGDAIVNAASCVNKGIEFQIGFRNRIGNVKYYIDANYSHVKNKVTSLGAGQPYVDGVSQTSIGRPIGYYYGYIADGIFKTQAELNAANQTARRAALKSNPAMTVAEVDQVFYQLPATSPGDVRYKDINGDGAISPVNDRTMIGNSIPANLYGLTLQLNYKALDLNIFLHAITGSQLYYSAYEQTRSMKAFQNQETYTLNRWKSESDPGNGIVPRAIIGDPAENSRPSTLMVSSGNYIKLRQLSFGYTLSDETLKRMGLHKFRVYASGSNLATLTKFEGYDPEFGGTNLRRGVTFLNYPSPRTFSLGLQVGL